MKCVVLQPSYIPWRGYFHQIQMADVFVFYDDVQYDRRGWRNRNRIKTPNGARWLTIPTHKRGSQQLGTPINEVPMACDGPAALDHWRRIEQLYCEAPYFGLYAPLVRSLYERTDRLLADFTIATTIALADALGIHDTHFIKSSSMKVGGRKTERLMNILNAVDADHYISGPSARAYLDEGAFRREGIVLEYVDYKYPVYPQLYPPFDGFVSIVDLLFMTGPDAGRYIWDHLL